MLGEAGGEELQGDLSNPTPRVEIPLAAMWGALLSVSDSM